MAKKDNQHPFKEKTIALKDAKSLTLEELTEKTDALKTENKDNETSLDRYIREHRAEIESAKKDRLEKTIEATTALDSFVKTVREDINKTEEDMLDTEQSASENVPDSAISKVSKEAVQAPVEPSETATISGDDANLEIKDASDISAPIVSSQDQQEDSVAKEALTEFPEVQASYDKVTLADDDASREQVIAEPVVLSDDHEEKLDTTSEAEKDFELVAQAPVVLSAKSDDDVAPLADLRQDQTPTNEPVTVAEMTSKSYKKPLIIGICAIVLIAAGGLAWHNASQTKQKDAQTTKESTQKSDAAKQLSDFNQQYAAFFMDSEHTKLKNAQFAKLNDLESALEKLTAHPDYKALKTKVAELKTEITTIQNLNNQFNKAVVVDGSLDKTAEVKDGVTLSYTATENATLNDLLKAAVAQGQSQQAQKSAAAKAAADKVAADKAAEAAQQAAQNSANANANNQSAASANNQANASSSNPTGSGLSTAQFQGQNPTIAVETSKSRVPVDPNADLSNPAFAWSNGIKDLVLGKCRQRGYISGDAYILLPASIQKGNGYYNLYKPDGTYLVSINCKTGYFVGNAAGHSDNLDY